MYREDQSGSSFMMGVLTGAVIGAGVALLFAPKAGNEMRQQLGEQYRGLANRVNETSQTLRDTTAKGRERVQQWSSQLSDRVSGGERQPTNEPTPADRFPSSAPSV